MATKLENSAERNVAGSFGNYMEKCTQSGYRSLSGIDPVTSPVFLMVPAKEKYAKPTKRVNELWQIDFTQLRVQG